MVNGVSNSTYTAATTSTTAATNTAAATTAETKTDDTAVVYEKSASTSSTKTKSKDNSAIIAKLQADSNARLSSLASLVQKLFEKQGKTYAAANSDIMNDSSFWNAIRTGDFTVDAETAAQAKADIAEDGYWGVNQTSDRLVDFAKAAAGGDSSKIEKMRSAIQKGFEAAKKLWGGELPGISQDTYDATMKKLDQWAEEAGVA